MSKHFNKDVDELFEAFLALQDEEECKRFLHDLCTIKELNDFAARLEVAKRLKAGENYLDISKATGASSATISRVSTCLFHGKGGYREILERMEEKADQASGES